MSTSSALRRLALKPQFRVVQTASKPAGDSSSSDEALRPGEHLATAVTTKPCSLLSIAASDLLRFGSCIQDALQASAWQRRQGLSAQIEWLRETNASMEESVEASRQLSGT